MSHSACSFAAFHSTLRGQYMMLEGGFRDDLQVVDQQSLPWEMVSG